MGQQQRAAAKGLLRLVQLTGLCAPALPCWAQGRCVPLSLVCNPHTRPHHRAFHKTSGITWMTKDGLKKPNYWGSLTQAATVRLGNYEGEEVRTNARWGVCACWSWLCGGRGRRRRSAVRERQHTLPRV